MIKKNVYLLFIIVLLMCSAQEITSKALSFNSINDITKYGLQHNAQVKTSYYKWESTKELPKKLSGLSDPTIGVRLNGAPAKHSDSSVDQKRYLLKQSFPFWGELSHKKTLGESKETIAHIDYLLTQNKIRVSIESLVYKLLLNDEL
ncbi:hypothetical protein DID80_08420, partial [Candidatus Marinamargulisbacteria bacterium SCGC AAA071-K20]